jgi:hypothetical protein
MPIVGVDGILAGAHIAYLLAHLGSPEILLD